MNYPILYTTQDKSNFPETTSLDRDLQATIKVRQKF